MNFFNKKGNSILIFVIIALVVSIGFFMLFQFSTSPVLVVSGSIPAGTKITQDMLLDGTIEIKEAANSLINEYTVKSFDEIVGKYAKENLNPGKMIFSYDVASSSDLRNNPYLQQHDLEAITIDSSNQVGLSKKVIRGDKVNIYGIYNYDFSHLFNDVGANGIPATGENAVKSIPLSALPVEIQDVFLKNGYTPESTITAKDITISKLLLQNVPIIQVDKEEDGDLKAITIGVDPNQAEGIYLTLNTGKIGMSIIPYLEDEYVEKDTKGSISFNELKNMGTIRDVEYNR